MQKSVTAIPLMLIFIFFLLTEWRWEAMLLGMSDTRPSTLAAAVSVIVILLGMFTLKKQRIVFWIILLLICYWISVSVLNIRSLAGMPGYNFISEFGVWCINLALFLTASNQNVWEYIYGHPKMLTTFYMLFVLPLFFLLWYSGCAAESNFNLRNAIWISGMAENSPYGVSYQSFGDKLAFLSFVVLSLNLKRRYKIVVLIVSFISLYVVGSKASMVGFIFACASCYVILLGLNRRYLKFASITFVSICLLCGGLVYIIGNSSLQNSDNWLVGTLARGRNDISVSSRHSIEKENETTRSSRILLGDYKFDNKLGRPGSYTHSAWGIVDYYGLPVFTITAGIWLYLLFKLLSIVRKTPIAKAALMSMLFYTLLFTIARFPPVFYLTYWVLGMAVCAVHHKTCVWISNKL